MTSPTRFTSGITTVAKTNFFGNYPFPAPFKTGSKSSLGMVKYENDFNTLIGTDYTVTGSSSTFTLTSGLGGLAVLTPGGATTASSAYKNGAFLQFQSGNQLWFACKFQLSALGGTAYVGLQAGASTNDGLWFAVSATGVVSLVSIVAGISTVLLNNLITLAAATWIEVGFYYTGTDLEVFINNVFTARVAAPTIGASGTTLTNAILGPVFQETPTATQLLTVDYVAASQELVRN
jgi:hypothetical protein